MSDIYNLLNSDKHSGVSEEYAEKYLHKIPVAPVVNRVEFLKKFCMGKTVLHVGSAGSPLHAMLKPVCKELWGLDKAESSEENYIQMDLSSECMTIGDNRTRLEGIEFDLVLLGEVLEHLSCPGELLSGCAYFNWPLIITVPNAFAAAGFAHAAKGIENVNLDHVSYFSYYTLKQLVERYSYNIDTFLWHGDPVRNKVLPMLSEGIIFLAGYKNGNL